MKILAYKYSDIPEDCKLVLEGEHKEMYIASARDGYKSRAMSHHPMMTLVVRGRFKELNQPIEFNDGDNISVTPRGVDVT